ncbi:MAG: Uma2 family endonuclease [Pirellulaceae bacterium]
MSTAKPTLKFTYQHYVLFPNDGNRHEIIDGDHYMNPAPSTYHQTVSKRLQYFLYSEIELNNRGLVFNAPVDLQLGPHDIVQPDLVVVLKESSAKVMPSKIIGPPDLVVEILSPSTEANDTTLKRQLYERTGVAEYWIFDPQAQSVVQFVLADGVYRTMPVPTKEISIHGSPEVIIQLDRIW